MGLSFRHIAISVHTVTLPGWLPQSFVTQAESAPLDWAVINEWEYNSASKMVHFLLAATKLGQGNVFTGVCDSVHRGGLPHCMLGCQPPPNQVDPPGTRQTPPRPHPPGSGRPHPGPGRPPPAREQTPAYGQWAAGTHPTGMHSCLLKLFIFSCFCPFCSSCVIQAIFDSPSIRFVP